ncbi:zinc-dependent peptidase [Pseudorhodoferax sp. Leaf267]|uniref:M90 family metallopeptidase n=1 Tax=Pseudorhodoferax sp. Leaf267 TaxID=1736316 RepID=UPI0006FF1929|nr:M90 family metallopeptidase [Pseudorhodoferax sp. Leaf267]KQP22044.1 hypothetical protein ASF43_24710 [Pseudorhodoferax sp. Leaf267]
MSGVWRRARHWLARLDFPGRRPKEIPQALWLQTLRRYPFLAQDALTAARLQQLAGEFLALKEFHGAGGLAITDAMAIDIAAQACLPLLHLRARPGRMPHGAGSPLVWYSDFVGIVVQPGDVVAKRETTDETGVVHHFDEVIAGEAMDRGPIMLSWAAVAGAGTSAVEGYNVVIHEFAHKMDMADGAADGCPPLQAGFLGAGSAQAARSAWFAAWGPCYEAFCEQAVVAERFGGMPPWLDPYGAQGLDEFFAVACEAYFVNRARFALDFASLMPSLDAFFRDGIGAPPRNR